MSKFKWYVLLTVILILLSCISSFAQTQTEMNKDVCREYKQADADMNKVYKQILNEYKSQTVFIAKMKAAQRAWLAFRDAHLASRYPEENKLGEYGSAYPVCQCTELTALTKQRTEVLKTWITGIEEGDVCTGSIKIKSR
jgi:uncharacterized protein YecT (DUF1311 family)